MPDFDRPVASADDAAEHLRALAHATRRFEDPGETYWVIGDLGAITHRLQTVLVNVASTHMEHRELAHTDDGNQPEGRKHAYDAAMALRQASALLEDVGRLVDDAQSHFGRIAWHRATPADRVGPEREPRGKNPELSAHGAADAPTTRVVPPRRPSGHVRPGRSL